MKSIQQDIKFLLMSAFVLVVAVFSSRSESFGSTAIAAESSVDLQHAIEQVAKASIPAVVHIEVTQYQEVANPFMDFSDEPFFRQFFGVPKNMPRKFQRKLMGLGSGVVIRSDGYILTNNHVVGGASKIVVTLSDGRVFSDDTVRLVGTDPKTDLAVIKVTSKSLLPALKLADSDQVQVGQWVVAIGQPQGLSESVTQGIISAKHRQGITEPTAYQDFLQTDAAINPGNSGGPLLDLEGRVVGINAAIVSKSGGFEGIGFAIPSNMAAFVSRQLIADGKVRRGWVGATIRNVTPSFAKKHRLPVDKGAYIVQIIPRGPADRAGLKKGDVIVGYQEREILNSGEFRNEVARTNIGQEVDLMIFRDGGKEQIKLRIGGMEEEKDLMKAALKKVAGLAVRPLNVKEAKRYGIDTGNGVVITSISPGSPFAKAGFEIDDAIISIDGQPVADASELDLIFNSLSSGQKAKVLAGDHRTGDVGYILVRIP